ncbi:MAG: PAS domain-containing protein, partial [Nodosilinea sp.]
MAPFSSQPQVQNQTVGDALLPPLPQVNSDGLPAMPTVLLLLDQSGEGLTQMALPSDCRTLAAATLAQALHLCHHESPDWIIIDFAWDEGRGLAFLATLGDSCAQRPLPVVLLVEPGQERAALEAMKLGAADYFFKAEFTPADLWERLSQPHRPLRTPTPPLEPLTKAQQAEEETNASRDQLISILERINDGIIALDRDGCFTYINHRAAQMIGHDPSEWLGQPIWRAFPDTVGQSFYDAFQRAIAQQQPVYAEQFYLHFNRWLENRIYPDANGVTIYITDISDRKAAAASRQQTQQLRHELSLLETTFDSILAGYWDIDFVANTAYMSAGLKAMFGYTDHELPDHPDTWQTLIYPDDLPTALDNLNRHIQSHGQVPYYTEVRYRHKNGSIVWVICAGQVIDWNSAGQPVRMVGCHVDITRLKHTEAQLRDSKVHLQSAQRIGHLGSWEFELATQHIVWSEQVYRIFGLTVGAEPPSFEMLQSYFHPDDQARHRQVVEATMATHQPYDDEFQIVRADGSPGHIHVKGEAVFDELGQLTHLTGTVQDISERKQYEAEMQSLSLRLSLALESGGIGTWTWNLNQGLTWDQRMYEIYGFSSQTNLDAYQAWISCVHPDDLPTVIDKAQNALNEDTRFDLEFRCRRHDGELRWIRSAATVRRTPTGEPIEMVGINYDITGHKQTAIELERLSLRLSLALES